MHYLSYGVNVANVNSRYMKKLMGTKIYFIAVQIVPLMMTVMSISSYLSQDPTMTCIIYSHLVSVHLVSALKYLITVESLSQI